MEEAGAYGSGDNGTAGAVADLIYTPTSMRFRAVSMYTNTPPKAAQRGPGGAQIVAMLEPIFDNAARELGIDRFTGFPYFGLGFDARHKLGPDETPCCCAQSIVSW